MFSAFVQMITHLVDGLLCVMRLTHRGRWTVMNLFLMMNTLSITEGVIDEHLRLMFH